MNARINGDCPAGRPCNLLMDWRHRRARRLVDRRAAATTTAVVVLLVVAPAVGAAQAHELEVTLIGNAGVVLSDGATSLLIDLPYEPGAFGYMRYDPDTLRPTGNTVSVITHHHRDHFDRSLFLSQPSWRIVGPPGVTTDIPRTRVITEDSATVGAFSIVVVPTPHTPEHRSYRIRWRGRILYFTGDTEATSAVPSEPHLDVLFVTPWLQCALTDAGRSGSRDRAVLYHRRTDGSDRICGEAEPLEQGSRFTLPAR